MSAPFCVERLAPHHQRSAFVSGVEPLDRYLHSHAGQDARRRVSACFVATERTTGKIGGYYTLAMSSVLLSDVPEAIARRLPHYPTIPTARLGRLAVDQDFRGRGLGGALLWDAFQRAAAAEIAAFALLVDAKDDSAAAFYRHHGFLSLSGSERTLFLPLSEPQAMR
ncbi:MAG: GNAT family N-acetyltransferase [Caulobacteraceae bacterium]|nr:GNAT family N-acetyltransferase [Caulobacter sp.]